MKHIILTMLLISTMPISTSVEAEEIEKNYSVAFVIPDILIYRPIGVAVTTVGAAIFAAISPFTALAQISPPHNAFEKTSNILIKVPVQYTFKRPVGDMSFKSLKRR